MENIGDRIKAILDETYGPVRGRQVRLAEIAGVTKARIGQLLRDPTKMGHEHAKNIEQKLGYRADWLLYGKLPKRLTEQDLVLQESSELNEVAELMFIYRQATDEARVELMAFARELDLVPATLRRPIRLNKP